MEKCLYCYKELPEGVKDFHAACARKIFGQSEAPLLPYTRDNLKDLAQEVIERSTAVTGVQAKVSLEVHKDSKHDAARFTIVGLWGSYILKPQTDLYSNLPELEDVTMHMAEAARISIVPHTLIRFEDGELCYLTKRIDRIKGGGKIAMEDMCQITERLTEQKYNGSYEQIAKAIAKYCDSPTLDLISFWEQVVFSWLTGNADMHLKNFSLFLPDGQTVRLTPGYDMLSTALVLSEDTEELALTLNGRKRKLKRADFAKAMATSGLSETAISGILNKFGKVKDKWHAWIDASFLPEEMKGRYKTLVDERLEMLREE